MIGSVMEDIQMGAYVGEIIVVVPRTLLWASIVITFLVKTVP